MLRVTNFFVVVFVSQLNVIPLLLNKRTKAPEQMGYQLNLTGAPNENIVQNH